MIRVREYQQVNVNTASPMELVLMLYDEGAKTLERAEQAFPVDTPDRIEQINNALLHAQDVITELAISLDMEKGGSIAKELQRIYDFMINHLSMANVKKELKPIQDVRKLMMDLREAWAEVAKQESQLRDLSAPPQSTAASASTIQISG